MFKLLIVIGITALATGSPLSRLDGKIVGGDNIDITDVPYQISIYSNGAFICGGSIISENYVLTAGHCSTRSSYTIRAGSNYLYKNGTSHKVIQKITHQGFTMTGIMKNDIALMKVEPPFDLDRTHKIIPMIGEGEFLAAGLSGLVSGWGRLSEGGQSPPQLQAVRVPLITLESCQEQYKYVGKIPQGQICAAFRNGGKDACQGDSGGPLVVKGLLAGIVSWGIGCARPSKPGVYTEVAHYRDWIREQAGL